MSTFIARDLPGAHGWQPQKAQTGTGAGSAGNAAVSTRNGLPDAPDRSDANYYTKLGLDRAHVNQLARSDRIAGRELPPEPAYAKASEQFFGEDGFSFGDVLDIVNPLHHLPVVGDLYREVTGDEISEGAKLAGSGLYGGPIGLVGGLANTIVESHTGKSIAGNVAGLIGGEDAPQVAAATLPTAATASVEAPQAATPPQAAVPQSAAPQPATLQSSVPSASVPAASAPVASASLARAAATAPDSAKIVELSESIGTGRQPGAQPTAAAQPSSPSISDTPAEQSAFGGFMRLPGRGEPTYQTPPDGPPNVADTATRTPAPQPAPPQLPDNAPVQLSGRASDVLLQLAEGSRPTPAAAAQPPEGGGSDPAPRSDRANEVLSSLAAGNRPSSGAENGSASPAITPPPINDGRRTDTAASRATTAGKAPASNESESGPASLNETAAAFINPPENIAESMLDALKKYEALKTTNG